MRGFTIRTLHINKSGVLWIGTEHHGLFKVKPQTTEPEPVSLPSFVALPDSRMSITTLLEDRSGRVWIGTQNGLFVYNDDLGTVLPIFGQQASRSRRESINADIVMSCYEDKTGLLWVGIYGGGVLYFQPEGTAFMSVSQLPGASYPLGAVFALLEDRLGWIWIGTRTGLHLYNPQSGGAMTFRHDKHNPRSISNDHVYCVYETRDGTIWIGTASGLNRYDPTSGNFIRYQYEGQGTDDERHNAIFTILEDRQGALWVGTLGGGLYTFHPTLQTPTAPWQVFRADAGNPQSLSNNVVRALAEDAQGNIWVGTRGGGVNCLTPSTSRVTRYHHDEKLAGSVSHNAIYSLFFDRRGRLWVGTQGGGVNVWLPEHQSWLALREKQGLANDVVYGVVEDRHGGIWLSSNKGLSVFNPDSLRSFNTNNLSIRNYDVRDGLQSNEFNAGAYCRGRSGRLYFGGIRGYTVFTPDSIRINPHIPPIVFTSFKVFNKEIPLAQRTQTPDTVRLNYGDTFFSIEFAALNYMLSEKNLYRYQLEHVDAGWIHAGFKREAHYTNISPGEYHFRVVGSNNNGLWNEQGATLVIIIKPPYWKTWWFQWGAGTTIMAIVVSVIVWRVRSISQREALRREIAQLELQSLRLHMNPHFIFNSINSIQYLISEGDNKAAMQYLSTFAQLMRRILQQTDLLYIAIADELELLDMYIKLEQLRYDDTFQYTLECPELAEIRHVLIPAMVVQPYVENALRHGLGKRTMGGLLRIRFSTDPLHPEALRCVVEDNGIGRAQAKILQHKSGTTEHLSIATSLTQRRLDVLHRSRFAAQQTPISVHYTDLKNPDDEPAGTRVEILLPIIHLQ